MIRNPFRDIDAKKLRRSSDLLKKQSDYQKVVNKRLHVVTLVTILAFTAISARLIDIQIRRQDEYTVKLESYASKKQVFSPPRGQMYDVNGNLAVGTITSHNIIYFPPEDITSDEEWALAEIFAKQFAITGDDLKLRDLQDLYIEVHTDANGKKDKASHLINENESALSSTTQYNLKLERITQEMVDAELSDEVRSIWKVYYAMNNGQDNESRVVVEDADDESVAFLTEHKNDFKGFDVDYGSWKRDYPYDTTLRDVLGQVTTNVQGVPSELRELFQAKGYALNERVGKSGLEQQYETILSGTKKVSSIKYDETDGTAIFTTINEGKKGYDLQLTIDMELQQKVDDVLRETLEKYKNNSDRPDFKKLFVTLANPNNGDIIAISGMMMNEDGTIINYASGNYLEGFTPGSIVKGATLYAGLNEGVVKPGEVINDTTMYIKGTEPKSSYRNHGLVNDVQAISVSSNIYMYQIAIRLGGASYVENGPLLINDPAATFTTMRHYYSMFGLGTITGLDIPNEQLGYTGYKGEAGQLLDFATGQYDNYTPIQILQYVSTIANDGLKVKPRLVSGAYGVNSKSLVYENPAETISTIYGDISYLDRVQEGMRLCVTSGNCGGSINRVGNDVAAKTGTAEVNILNEDGLGTHKSTNASLVGYAPYDEPSVAFVCAAPTSSSVLTGANRVAENTCYNDVMGPVLTAYFDKYGK